MRRPLAQNPRRGRIQRRLVTVGERIAHILAALEAMPQQPLTFYDLVPLPTTKAIVVMTFLAVLELIRRGRVRLTPGQHGGILVGLRTLGEPTTVPGALVVAAGHNG